jgi:hypothetical protein
VHSRSETALSGLGWPCAQPVKCIIHLVWLPQVYDSLKQSAGMPEEVLEFFSQEGGQHRLYELRFLPVSKRAAPALYMAENNVDQRVRECPLAPPSTQRTLHTGSNAATSASPRFTPAPMSDTAWTIRSLKVLGHLSADARLLLRCSMRCPRLLGTRGDMRRTRPCWRVRCGSTSGGRGQSGASPRRPATALPSSTTETCVQHLAARRKSSARLLVALAAASASAQHQLSPSWLVNHI